MTAPASTASPTSLDAAAHARILALLAVELSARPAQVEAAVALLDQGATVPFIARYRKEATGGLDDTQLRTLDERLIYLRELEERRATVRASLAELGHLTPALDAAVQAADSKQRLEDLYAPFKPKRRTRGQIAREAGLEPLADALLADPTRDPQLEALAYVAADRGVADVKAALDGARDLLAERWAEDADLIAALRERLWTQGEVVATVVEGKQAEGEKFRDWFAHREPLRAIASHRALALLRGRAAGVLQLKAQLPEALETQQPHPCEAHIATHVGVRQQGRAADAWLAAACRWTWRVKAHTTLELESFARMREAAEAEAIAVFGRNLKDLLLAAPAPGRAVMGLDPGLRTGVKVAVVDATGKLLATDTVFPHEPRRDWDGALHRLAALARTHAVQLVAIGNGTASRETDKLAADLMQRHPDLALARTVVSEAGASVYSASALAAAEFPALDVSLRGAVSIARRLQDPLAELVKIEPKSIGVGQYQHDVHQGRLARALDAVVEDCVNAVGVDVNTASAALLARVSGLTPALARQVVEHRERHGAFGSRAALREVARFGDRSFEQAAGFLRIRDGLNPLDASAVHPEAYPVVERILAQVGQPLAAVMGRSNVLRALSPASFTDERFGLPTVQDILRELDKPGRDPRGEFRAVAFREGVDKLSDLVPGMLLDGVVTNVANFGAFIDIGVHQDGLAHMSQLSERFVKDPREVVRAGQHVKVRVLEVDVDRKRVALTLRLEAPAVAAPAGANDQGRGRSDRPRGKRPAGPPAPATAMSHAFDKLRR